MSCDCNQTKAFIGEAAQAVRGSVGRPELAMNALARIEEVGEIRGKLRQLEEAISILTDERDRLGSKLSPVLQCRPKDNQKDVPTSPSMTEVGGIIQTAIDRVYGIARSLNTFREDVSI